MAIYFLDTWALVKRYVAETGTGWVRAPCDPAAGHSMVIAQAAQVETVASLCRKARDGKISTRDRDRIIAEFRQDVRRSYSVERVTTAVYERAGILCLAHPLRAYDAVQLACALTLRDRPVVSALGLTITFVCADSSLLGFAATEGLATDNPYNHP